MAKPATEYRSGRHCVFQMHAHLVFTPKYRRKLFEREHIEALREIFAHVCESFDVQLVEFNGESDHVHLLINFPPHVAPVVAKAVSDTRSDVLEECAVEQKLLCRLMRRSAA